MAGRSDFTSTYPRVMKRMVAMGAARGYITNEREVRKILIEAHGHHKRVKNKRTLKDVSLSNVDSANADNGET